MTTVPNRAPSSRRPSSAGRERSFSTPATPATAKQAPCLPRTAQAPPCPRTADEWKQFLAQYKRVGGWTQPAAASSTMRPSSSRERSPSSSRRPLGRRSMTANDVHAASQSRFAVPSEVIDPMRFFLTAGYLPAPLPTRKVLQSRRAALRQYGFSKPGQRVELARYTKHARRVFHASLAQITTACAENDHVVMCVTEDRPQSHDDPALLFDRSTSICAHAMLLVDNQVLVIPDLEKDWRFKANPSITNTDGRRFYASAPMLVDAPDMPEGSKICIGRLSIAAQEPRYDFGDEEAAMLAEIAQMACESLQQELHRQQAQRAQKVQQAITEIADFSWNNPGYHVDLANDGTTEAHRALADLVVKTLAECLEASATIVDTTAYRLSTARTASVISGSRSQVASPNSSNSAHLSGTPFATSPRTVRLAGRDYSSGWSSHSASVSADETYTSPSLDTPSQATTPELAPLEMTGIGSSSSSGAPGKLTHSRSSSRNIFGKSASSWEEPQTQHVAQIDPAHKPFIFAHTGSVKPACVGEPRARAAIGRFLAEWRRERDYHGSVKGGQSVRGPYLTQPSGPSSMSSPSEDGGWQGSTSGSADSSPRPPSLPMDPLGALFEPTHKPAMYMASPITADVEDPQAAFLLFISWDEVTVLQKTDFNLLTACTRIIEASLLRQRARLADRTQLDFVRSIQHEMRTPLNGISGVTELLRASVASGGKDLDMSPDGFLSGCLEGIRLAAGNVSSILDDVLDFGDLSGIRSATAAAARLDETYLAPLVEEVGQEEVEVAAITLRHSAELRHGAPETGVDVRPPDFFVSIDPSLRGRYRVDRTTMRKVFRKLLHNAFRFNSREEDPGAYVEVKIRPLEEGGADAEVPGANGVPPSPSAASLLDDCTGPTMREVWVAFDFIDSGCGMDSNFVKTKYLQPFAKADPFKQGTGLGGAIAAGLTQRLGGHMDVSSEPGKGTKVTIALPLVSLGGDLAPCCHKSCPQRGCELAVHKAAFVGFEDAPGMGKRMAEMLRDHLQAHGVSCGGVIPSEQQNDPNPSQADLVIASGLFLANRRYRATPGSVPELPFKPHPQARFVVVTADPLHRKVVIPGLGERDEPPATHLFQPPFGPAALATLLDFLREEKPFVLREPPTPRHSHAPVIDEQKASMVAAETSSTAAPVAEQKEKEATPASSPPSQAAQPSTISTGLACAPSPPVDHDATFRVLAVEDNPTNMKILTVVLQRLGIQYAEAHDGGEAIEQYKAYRPHLVLLDISLPVADGFEVCRQMRAHVHDANAEEEDGGADAVVDVDAGAISTTIPPASEDDGSSVGPTPSWTYRRPRIAAVTALSSKEDQRKGLDLGMDEWHTKPLAPRVLTTLLKAWKQDWEEEREERRRGAE